MLARLEVRVRETNKYFAELSQTVRLLFRIPTSPRVSIANLEFLVDVGEELHRVRSENTDVLVMAFGLMLYSERLDPLLHILRNLGPDFHSYILKSRQPLPSRIELLWAYIPNIRVSGSFCASDTISPPKPHPISATSTCFPLGLVSASPSAAMALGKYFGKWLAQTISFGLDGLPQHAIRNRHLNLSRQFNWPQNQTY